MKRFSTLCLAVILLLSLLSGCFSQNETPSGECSHKDDDNDGICDICIDSVITVIDLYAINDIHGKFLDTEKQNGVDEMTTYLKDQKKKDEYSIFLSSGDTWQGSAESVLTGGAIFTDWMNHLGFSAMTIGNHEFDWGEEGVKKQAALAEFPLLAINVFDADTDKRVSYADASVTVTCGEVMVGIIGAIGDCYSSIAADKSEGVYFKTGHDLTELVKKESEALRAAGVDLIVYSLHDGYDRSHSQEQSIGTSSLRSYYDTSLSNGYVDLVFEAHTHQHYVLRDVYGVCHLQGGGENKGISHAEVAVNSANGHVEVEKAEYVQSYRYASLEDDPVVAELSEKYKTEIDKGREVLGTVTAQKKSNQLCQLAAELYLEKGMAMWGKDYPIALAGAFMQTRSPYDLAPGEVTYADLLSLFPFNNELMLCSISGADLKRVFYESPHESYYIRFSSYGSSLSGKIDDTAVYYVITDSYSSSYKYNNMTEIATYAPDVFARDLLADYIKTGKLQ